MKGLEYEECTKKGDLEFSPNNCGYRSYNGQLFVRYEHLQKDATGRKDYIRSLDDEDEVKLFRSTSDDKYVISSSWTDSLHTALDWGSRRHENGQIYLCETTVKKKDIFHLNIWTFDTDMTDYNEVVVPYDKFDLKDIKVTKLNLRRPKLVKKYLRENLNQEFVSDIKKNWNWWNTAVGKHNNTYKRDLEKFKSDKPFEELKDSLLLKIYNVVKRKYDLNKPFNSIGLPKTFSVPLNELTLTKKEMEQVENVLEMKRHDNQFHDGFPWTKGMES